jgi:hypothetical protein
MHKNIEHIKISIKLFHIRIMKITCRLLKVFQVHRERHKMEKLIKGNLGIKFKKGAK